MNLFDYRASSLVLLVASAFAHAFVPYHHTDTTRLSFLRAKNSEIIFYSPNFQRHVVCESKGKKSRVLESFLWLDQAKSAYPKAKLVPFKGSDLSPVPRIAGGGLEEDSAYDCTRTCEGVYPSIASATRETLQAYEAVVSRFRSPLGSSLLQHFPESDQHSIKERIIFLLSPTHHNVSDHDWPRAFNAGYGAGLTPSQVITAIVDLRHILFVDPLESSSQKLPAPVLFMNLRIPLDLVNEARFELGDYWLRGASPSDAASFAYLHAGGVSWDQCRVMLGAFSASLISCDLDPSWELLEAGPIRSSLSETSIHYLRARLQLIPSEVHSLIKSHSRLTSYSVQTLRLHLDELQASVQLSSNEVQRIVFRSPSVLGVSVEKLNSRVSFLYHEGKFKSLGLCCQHPSTVCA
jgi:hypothetical protein